MSQNLSEHGLVYLADANFVINKAESQGYNLNLFLFPLTINQTLTKKAKKLQEKSKLWGDHWHPVVLQKEF